MRHDYLLALSITMISIISCAYNPHVEVTKTGNVSSQQMTASNPDDILIYRSFLPAWEYQEIGVLTLRGENNISFIYEKFRADAAKQGADAIIHFNLDSEEHEEWVRNCTTVNGIYSCTSSLEIHIHYTASGTMIKKKESP